MTINATCWIECDAEVERMLVTDVCGEKFGVGDSSWSRTRAAARRLGWVSQVEKNGQGKHSTGRDYCPRHTPVQGLGQR